MHRFILLSVLPVGLLRAQAPARIPLCPGLTVTTAVRQVQGDYESIKTVVAMTGTTVQLRYSSERLAMDMFDNKPQMIRTNVARHVRRVDLDTATLYLQQYSEFTPVLVPGTTAIGTSAAVLRALKAKGEATVGVFLPVVAKVSEIPGDHPSVYDHQMVAPIRRIGGPGTLRVIVDDQAVMLPTIRAGGEFFGDSVELTFLDDPANPLTLLYRFGVGGVTQLDVDMANPLLGKPKAGDDKDTFRVVKLSTRCQGAPPPPSPAGGPAGDPLETALATNRRADLYQVYFTFNSDTLREESLPAIARIAALMNKHPEWTLQVNGHTDNVASDSYNLTLSRRRAAAVKRLLVTRHGIADARLRTDGFGESQPRDTNDTLEGRARNRRVELVRIDP